MSTSTLPPADAAEAHAHAMLSANGWGHRNGGHDLPFIGERTCPAAVAYDLMRDIMLDDPARPAPSSPEFRAYLLDLYAECLIAVRGKRALGGGRGAPAKRNGNSSQPPK